MEPDKTVVIEAPHYAQTRERLQRDPIIRAMAAELPVHRNKLFTYNIMHEDGTPTYEFMVKTLDEYRERGGTDGGHIGGCAQAVLRVWRELHHG